jgi:hypothetical protein
MLMEADPITGSMILNLLGGGETGKTSTTGKTKSRPGRKSKSRAGRRKSAKRKR